MIVDVEATQSYRKSEVNAARTMIDRTEKRFGLKPKRLLGDGAYGSAEFLGWMVDEKGIEPHVTLLDTPGRPTLNFTQKTLSITKIRIYITAPQAKNSGNSGTRIKPRAAASLKIRNVCTDPETRIEPLAL